MKKGRMGGEAESVNSSKAASPVRTWGSRGIASWNAGARREENMGYVRSNMEDPFWVSRILVGRSGAPSRQPGQGTRWERRG